jgi:hypothetical protein
VDVNVILQTFQTIYLVQSERFRPSNAPYRFLTFYDHSKAFLVIKSSQERTCKWAGTVNCQERKVENVLGTLTGKNGFNTKIFGLSTKNFSRSLRKTLKNFDKMSFKYKK